MMIDFPALVKQYNIDIKGLIHIGCHYFQERDIFLGMGINKFVLVEPQEDIFAIARERTHGLDAIMFNCALSDYIGEMNMYCDVVNQSQSSSLLEPKLHLEKYPNIIFPETKLVTVNLLDNLEFNRNDYNCICIDVQGNEGNVFRGASETLKSIDCIMTEVNFVEMYKDCVLIFELDKQLSEHGFTRVSTGDNYNNQGWSDAFYIKE